MAVKPYTFQATSLEPYFSIETKARTHHEAAATLVYRLQESGELPAGDRVNVTVSGNGATVAVQCHYEINVRFHSLETTENNA